MVLKALILLSIILQLIAVVVAIRLTRITRYNVAWMFFTLALVAMCVLRLNEFFVIIGWGGWRVPPHFMAWVGVVTSLCFAVGMFYIGKIFNSIRSLNYQRRLTERRILTTVLRTEEKERLNFSKELHDGLGPLLSSAKMSLSELSKIEHNESDAELIKNTSYVIDEAIRSIREISNKLSPHTLNTFGLAKAVNNFINKAVTLHKGGSIDVKFDTNLKSERFDPNVEVILYRVICELITNSIKHSGASLLTLSAMYSGNMLTIEYADNGKGFDTAAVMDTGMGLSNITTRIQSLKGTASIESHRMEGMKAHIVINLKQTDDREKKL